MSFINKLSKTIETKKRTTYIVGVLSLLIVAGGLWYLGVNGYLFKSSQAIELPTIQFYTDNSTVTETDSNFMHSVTVSFNVQPGYEGTDSIIVIYEINPGAATTADYSDLSPNPGQIIFNPQAPGSALIQLDIIGDNIPEKAEDFSIELISATGSSIIIDPKIHTVTILDDDDGVPLPPLVQFDLSASDAPESVTPHSVGVSLDKEAIETVIVTYNVINGSASDQDYSVNAPWEVVFSSGDQYKTIDIDILHDIEDEGDEDFTISIGSIVGGDPGGQLTHTVTILDDDESVASFIVDAPDKIATTLAFDVTVTARDQYNSIITNFDDNNITLGYTEGSYMSDIIFNQGVLSAWENGVATFQNAVIDFTLPVGVDSDFGKILVNHAATGASGEADVEFVRNLVIVEIPNDSTFWHIEDTENIVFRAGGETAVDHIAIYYSESKGFENTWILIEDDITYNSTQPQSYSWDIPIVTIPGIKDFMVKVETYNATDDVNPIAEGTSDLFIIRSAPELVGTFTSQEFVIADPSKDEVLQSLDGFSAFADDGDPNADGINSKLDFYIKFLDGDGDFLGTSSDGWIAVNPGDNLNSTDFIISLIERVQFRVYMETVDITLYNPWVESISLDYTVDIPDPTSDFNLSFINANDDHRTTIQGATLIFDINVHRDQDPKFLEGIEFSSTILTTTEWDKIVDQESASSRFKDPLPDILLEDDTLILTIKILDIVDATYLDQEYSFTITGISTGAQQLERSIVGYITVASDEDINNPAITINASIPLDLGLSDDLTTPEFTLRLYKPTVTDPDSPEHEVSGITADSYDDDTKTATLQIDIAAGIVTNNTTYAPYIRTTRHLWDKAITNFTVNSNDPTYDIEFPKLVIGDISLDNAINVVDFNKAILEFGQIILLPLLADFNNDGVVNVVDIGLLFPNWFKSGVLPSD